MDRHLGRSTEPHNLKIECYVNGEIRQSSNTDDMIWNCYEQIEYLSSAMTLYPGDIIATAPLAQDLAREAHRAMPIREEKGMCSSKAETLSDVR